MAPDHQFRRKNIDKTFLSKNKTIKLYKEKVNKINLFKKEVEELQQKYNQVDSQSIEKFDDFPLSDRTKRALKKCGYFTPTEIQKESILLSLQERDVLGAAKTGSGKTLAFVIPLLERLYVSGWTILDGLGALIITPTRELAYQIYEVINKVGAHHQFSVGLIIGGKDLAKERKLLDKCNIMICTPGRLLQHMDENPLFDSMNLKLLILDEADRILDLGFAKTVNAILENLPEERQTLLFSATQTKSVKDLARLSLKSPVYVSVDEHAMHTTPEALQQNYMVCEAHDKMNILWSFIKSHKKQKILIFMASCKQVKFTFESICRLRPGVSIMALYGSLHQLKRMQIYDEFCKKNHVVMLATDIASRGLDFPNVNWVVQLDCPEDVNTYIHRAGRTARYQKGGESLLVLLPSEKDSMVEQLKKRKIPIEEIKVNPNKLTSVQRKLEAILLRDKELKESGIRAFKAYLKNIFLMKDKSVYNVMKIDVNLYANSLGLNFVPRIRFLEKHIKGYKENSRKESSALDESHKHLKQAQPEDKTNLMNFPNTNEDSENDHLGDETFPRNNFINCDDRDDSGTDLLDSREQDIAVYTDEEPEVSNKNKLVTKSAMVKKALQKRTRINTVVKFDDQGKALREVGGKLVPDITLELRRELLAEDYHPLSALKVIEKESELDKQIYKEKIKTKHRTERLKEKEKRWLKNPGSAPPTLKESNEQEDSDTENDVSADEVDPNNMSLSESDADDVELHSNNGDISEDGIQCRLGSNEATGESFDESRISDQDETENILSNKTSLTNESTSEENNSDESSQSIGKKRKKFVKVKKNKKQCVRENEKKIKTGRTIEDDEQLALHFLSNL